MTTVTHYKRGGQHWPKNAACDWALYFNVTKRLDYVTCKRCLKTRRFKAATARRHTRVLAQIYRDTSTAPVDLGLTAKPPLPLEEGE